MSLVFLHFTFLCVKYSVCKMGGSKSKPVVETARQVLAKRRVEAEAASSAIRDAAEMDLIPYIQVWYDPEVALRGTKYQPDANDMDVNTIQEMSKWDLFSSTTENAQVLDKTSKVQPGDVASAALLRIQEEKEMDRKMAEIVQSNIKNRTQVPQIRAVKGRISEAKLVAMYNRFRDAPHGSYSVMQASVDFGLPEETIELLLEIARSPLIVAAPNAHPGDLLIAK